jgi:hypothetical protein
MSHQVTSHQSSTRSFSFRSTICAAALGVVVASVEAMKAAFMPDSDDTTIIAARSGIEAYALARVKKT